MISVGNLSSGGTGKTPTVEMVVRDLVRWGRRPAILSRGYGGRYPRGDNANSGAGNDEFHVLAANLPKIPHYQGGDRYASAQKATAAGADVLVLDDGFQHVRLARDFDLVLVDALSPFDNGSMLPAGLLREPLEVLERADLFGVTRSDLVSPEELSTLANYLRRRFPGVPQVHFHVRPLGWTDLDGNSYPLEALVERKVLAFCGIGRPESFRLQLTSLGVSVVDTLCFRDHHRYTEGDIQRILARSCELRVDEVVMTQKDAVKLAASAATDGWKALRIEQEIVSGLESYRTGLRRACNIQSS